ncbi:hypothetical protein [Longispora albida]|uniref:hypothetical protein n=1 Tax=Longispora albida TaxID=203523 RepID=UPI0012FB8305|nr:hypothetical protein [Longispora albida]
MHSLRFRWSPESGYSEEIRAVTAMIPELRTPGNAPDRRRRFTDAGWRGRRRHWRTGMSGSRSWTHPWQVPNGRATLRPAPGQNRRK